MAQGSVSSWFRAVVIAGALVGVLAGAPARADDDPRAVLKSVEADKSEAETEEKRSQRDADRAERDLARLSADLVAAAIEARRFEDRAQAAEAEIAGLEMDAETARAQLLSDRASLEATLAALMTYGQRRPPAFATHPGETDKAIRAAILMGDAAPALNARAKALSQRIIALRTLIDEAEAAKAALIEAEADLNARRVGIQAMIAEKEAAFREARADAAVWAERAAQLAQRATSLRDLVRRVEAEARARALAERERPRRAIEAPDGVGGVFRPGFNLSASNAGVLKTRFGDRLETGRRSDGETYLTRRRAQVVAPRNARIEFAGDVPDVGPILILDAGEGYHIVLSGLRSLYGAPGQDVLAGEPIGEMPDRSDPQPELYLELRRNGAPVNPRSLRRSG